MPTPDFRLLKPLETKGVKSQKSTYAAANPGSDRKPAPVGLYARESDDNYPAMTHLDDRHRVINCRDGIQWIVQRRMNTSGSGWRGLSFCRTREALIRDAERRLGAPIPKDAAAILSALPERHPERVSA